MIQALPLLMATPLHFIHKGIEKTQAIAFEMCVQGIFFTGNWKWQIFSYTVTTLGVITARIFCVTFLFFLAVTSLISADAFNNYTRNLLNYLTICKEKYDSSVARTAIESIAFLISESATSLVSSLYTHYQIVNIKKCHFTNDLCSSYPYLECLISYVSQNFFIFFPEIYASIVVLSHLAESIQGYNPLQHLSVDEAVEVVYAFDLSFSIAEKIFPKQIQSEDFYLKLYNKQEDGSLLQASFYFSEEARVLTIFAEMLFSERKAPTIKMPILMIHQTPLTRALNGEVNNICQFHNHDKWTYCFKAAFYPFTMRYSKKAGDLILKLNQEQLNIENPRLGDFLKKLHSLFLNAIEVTKIEGEMEDLVTSTIDPNHQLRDEENFHTFIAHLQTLQIPDEQLESVRQALKMHDSLIEWNNSVDKSHQVLKECPELFVFCSLEVLLSEKKFNFDDTATHKEATIMSWLCEQIQHEDRNFVTFYDVPIILKKAVIARKFKQYELCKNLCTIAKTIIEKHNTSSTISIFMSNYLKGVLQSIPNLPSGMR